MKNDYKKEELYRSLKDIIKTKREVIFISRNLAYFGSGDTSRYVNGQNIVFDDLFTL